MKKLFYVLIILPFLGVAQSNLTGTIYEIVDAKEVPLLGANVFWQGTQVGAVTDIDGKFSLPYKKEYSSLIVSYVGFVTDTITIDSTNPIKHVLRSNASLDEITIKNRKKATSRSFLDATNVINVSSAELLKAACCNLSESFETNPSIDVNFANAITGARQIRMLGLTSPYSLITVENIPTIRGASQTFGMSFIPGTWVESIQITKGAGSVVNGFESIAGQINAEMVKPTTDDPLFVNAYGAIDGRYELNTHLNHKISDKWSTGLYLHGNIRAQENDMNNDSFLDMPLQEQINVMNRWQYTDAEKGFVSFLSLNYLKDDKQVGQVDFNPDRDRGTTNAWGGEIDTQRYSFTGKIGYVFPEIPYQSLGVQFSYSNHTQDSYFGLRDYTIAHESLYASTIFKSIIGDSRHNFKTGISTTYDGYQELVDVSNFSRVERSVGGFFEYAYDDLEDFTMTAGVRIDTHNLLGTFITPRWHARYTPWDKAALRASVGRGKRSANIFTENQSLFSTNRAISILDTNGAIYGLNPEIAWNYGLSFLQGFNFLNKKGEIALDFYRTDFQNQVVVDWENSQEIRFYNLDGASFANSFQVELGYNPWELVDVKVAYKFYDVQTDYLDGQLERPLTPKHRFFANASYETLIDENKGTQWKFDATYNWLGEQRFASTLSNPIEFQLPENSPTLGTLNAQLTRVFSPRFEVYAGGENITNQRQENPILGSENPFGNVFDTTYVFGPIFGSNYYIGLRFKM